MNKTRFIVLLTLLVASLILPGCSQKLVTAEQEEAKMDAPLLAKMNEVTQAESYDPIQCLVKLSSTLDAEKRGMLSRTGITKLTVVNDVASIAGSPGALRKVARLEFVLSMSLSQAP